MSPSFRSVSFPAPQILDVGYSSGVSTLLAESPMSLSFAGADAPSARGSQPRSSDVAELSRGRAVRPAQAKGPPHKQMPESGKTKRHWAESLRHTSGV